MSDNSLTGVDMVSILIITIITTILLAAGYVISAVPAILLVVSCLLALALIVVRNLQRRRLLNVRVRQCQAVWGSNIQHLGGLPLPIETQGILLLTDKELLFESDHLTQSFNLDSLISILALSAEQLRNLPDASICAIMGSGHCQSLAAAREHVRRSAGGLKQSTILLLHYHEGWQSGQTMSLVILALEQKPAQTRQLLENGRLKQVIRSYRPANLNFKNKKRAGDR